MIRNLINMIRIRINPKYKVAGFLGQGLETGVYTAQNL